MSSTTLFAGAHNNPHYEVCNFAEEWHQRLTLSNPDFINRYINMQMWVFVHFRIGTLKSTSPAFRALMGTATLIILRAPSGMENGFSGMYPGPVFSLFFGFDSCLASCVMGGSSCEEQMVLVSIVKFSEFPEKVVPTPCMV